VVGGTIAQQPVTAHRPFRAVRAAQNTVRAVALCGVLSPPHLGRGVFAAQNPVTRPKRQLPMR